MCGGAILGEKYRYTQTLRATMHTVTDRETDGRPERRQDYANSRSCRVAVPYDRSIILYWFAYTDLIKLVIGIKLCNCRACLHCVSEKNAPTLKRYDLIL